MANAHRGEAALKAFEWTQAIDLFTKAIADSPTSPVYHIHRSTAYQKTRQYDLALSDADKAVVFAKQRAKRELIAQAQLKRAVPLFFLKQYGDAKACLAWAKKMDEKEKMVAVWEGQIEARVKKLEEGDDAMKVTVLETPELIVSKEALNPATATAAVNDTCQGSDNTNGPARVASSTPVAATPTQTPREKIRHDWYQDTEKVVLTVLAKGVPKDKAQIEIESTSLSISFSLVSGSQYDFSLEPLYAPIDPAASSFRLLSTKIEVTLKKSTPGQKWHALENTEVEPSCIPPKGSTDDAAKHAVLADEKPSGPTYPTSSRTGPKNWDKILEKKPKTTKTSERSASSSATDTKAEASSDPSEPQDETAAEYDPQAYESDEDGSGDPNFFFKKLYAGASDDVKKAMMKSYQESGGTALSTDWKEVSKARVPIDPPEGMEAHEYEGARSKKRG